MSAFATASSPSSVRMLLPYAQFIAKSVVETIETMGAGVGPTDSRVPFLATNTHYQLVQTLTNCFGIIRLNPLSKWSRSEQKRLSELLQCLTESGIGLLPLCAAREETESARMRRTSTLIWLCIRSLVAQTNPPQQCKPRGRLWMHGTLQRGDPSLDAPIGLFRFTHSSWREDEDDLDIWSGLYFAQSKQCMLEALLLAPSTNGHDDNASWNHLEHAGAQALVEAADADLGTQVFRELIATFKLPREAVAPRRVIFFDRATRRRLEQDHFDVLHDAHMAAVQKPSHVWEHGFIPDLNATYNAPEDDASQAPSTNSGTAPPFSKNMEKHRLDSEEILRQKEALRKQTLVSQTDSTVERICAILAGIYVNLVQNVDAARVADAFSGKVELPFLQVPSSNRVPRGQLKLFVSNGEWVTYSVQSKQIKVHTRGYGLKGLCDGACKLIADHHLMTSKT